MSEIAGLLDEQEIVASDFWFRVYAVGAGQGRSLQAVAFELTPGMSYASIVELLGDSVGTDVSMTIPEGYTIAQIGELVVDRFEITELEWSQMVGQFSPIESTNTFVSSHKPDEVDLEGYLFPDTYRFFADATAEEIAWELVEEMREKYESVEGSSTLTTHEVLTLASIIQREVQNPDEMAMVADIFLKRLEIGMALQADSTVNYITGGDSPAISLEDRDIDSLYNTYQYAGLPPGPISNPGLDAINAVFNPIPNDYYYFLTTPEGEVKYAVTHDQHTYNKALYLN